MPTNVTPKSGGGPKSSDVRGLIAFGEPRIGDYLCVDLLCQALDTGFVRRYDPAITYAAIACCPPLCLPNSWCKRIDKDAEFACSCKLVATLCPEKLFGQEGCAIAYDISRKGRSPHIWVGTHNLPASSVLCRYIRVVNSDDIVCRVPPCEVLFLPLMTLSVSDISRTGHYRPLAYAKTFIDVSVSTCRQA